MLDVFQVRAVKKKMMSIYDTFLPITYQNKTKMPGKKCEVPGLFILVANYIKLFEYNLCGTV